jgi:large subunit ribosomal protein L17
MEIADFWLTEKQLVHKLFKVLVPRYENYQTAYTRLVLAPNVVGARYMNQAILELRGIAIVL